MQSINAITDLDELLIEIALATTCYEIKLVDGWRHMYCDYCLTADAAGSSTV
jgi:hypothetical protein